MDNATNFGSALAEFAVHAQLSAKDTFSKLSFLNWLGCAAAGAHERSVDIFASFYEGENPCGQAFPIGRHRGVSSSACAAIDCMSSAVFAYDDIHFPTSLHPCGPVASAILALARTQKLSGKDCLTALKTGMEVEVRAAEALFGPGTETNRGWYSTGIAGGIGAAAAVGRLLGLDREHMEYALGLAAASASGTRGMHTAMSFCLSPALAAEAGYRSAMLARSGFSCRIKSLSGANGLIQMIASKPNYTLGLDKLGEVYHCEESVCKIYPFGFVAYAAINCADELQKYASRCGKTVQDVVLTVSPVSKRLGGSPFPENVYDSLVCLRYITAGVLTSPDFAYTPISEEFRVPQHISNMMENIRVEADAGLGDKQALISARFTDGTGFSYRCTAAIGSEDAPPSDDAVISKFLTQVSSAVSPARAELLLKKLLTLEEADDMRPILSMLMQEG